MKYILLVGDGMADRPCDELGGRTILEASNTPNMDAIAAKGRIGLVSTVPDGMVPASDVANMSIMGYDPKLYYTGRGPLEAANNGISIKEGEVIFRCNTVTVSDDTMVDYSAGHITTKESVLLIEELQKTLGGKGVTFYPGIGYRHLVALDMGSKEKAAEFLKLKCTPPHDITGQKFKKFLPKGKEADIILDLMEKSRVVLAKTDVNKVRIDLNENPANMIWLWGQGVKPVVPSFREQFNMTGAVISAVDLINGMGKIIGLDVIKVPGATGYYDTNYKGKGEYAIEALKNMDFVFVHVEAPDEAGHNGDLRAKITAVENFDRYVVGTILDEFKDKTDYRILVLPDHATPVKLRTHTGEPVPFAICGSGITPDGATCFTEQSAKSTELFFDQGSKLMAYLTRLEK